MKRRIISTETKTEVIGMVDVEREPLSVRVQRVVKYLSRPLTSATLFYALYILGDEHLHYCRLFAQRLRTFSEDLAKALYDFGICMVVKELNLHAYEAFYPLYAPQEYVVVRGERVPVKRIDPAEVSAFWQEIYEEGGEKRVEEVVRECINKVYPQYFPGKYETVRMLTTCIVDRLNNQPQIMIEPRNLRENARWVRTWLEYYQKFKSSYFWDAAIRIFSITGKECEGWIEGYGGKNYAMIATVMRECSRLSPVTFVDHCFSLEHQTAVFIYKLATSPEEDHLIGCFVKAKKPIPSALGIIFALRALFNAARRGSEEDVRLILRCATSARQDWVAFGFVDIGKASNPPAGLRLRQLRIQSEAFLRRIARSLR